ncbi:MAG: bifunctional salicylyl-CoA 5-hydroxylase/oxidoreductase, partial [Acidimicrobiia bacterium]
DDRCPGGVSADEGTETARLLAAGGAALVDVAAGYGSGGEASAPDYRPLFNVDLAERVRNQVGVAVACGGHITRIDEMNTILAAGRADLCRIDPRRYLRNGGVS